MRTNLFKSNIFLLIKVAYKSQDISLITEFIFVAVIFPTEFPHKVCMHSGAKV